LTAAISSDIVPCVFDMKLHNRINMSETTWMRCKSVILRDGVLHCSLATERTYVLTEAYENDPHISFASAETDQDLIAFVRAWGPLYLNEEQARSGATSLPLSYCRAFQGWLRAQVDLLAAFKRAEGEQAALHNFVEAEYEYARNTAVPSNEPIALEFLRRSFGISGDIVQWVKGAELRAVRAATDFLVPLEPIVPLGARLICRRRGNRREVEASWAISTLEGALRWMVWYDEFTQHPILCCQECRKVFRGQTAHARKYCSPEHAHRATARNWQRRKSHSKQT
jgi:hypothetical protein